MNELQKAELEILKNVINVCKKLGLTWYMVCGSALGSVKYSGFIPWDDDVDIAMPRRDYETFCREAPGLLPPELFVQTAETDPAFPQIYCKVRNSATTFIESSVKRLDINHGVYIDVFPLDGYPAGKIRQLRLELMKSRLLLILSSVAGATKETRPAVRLAFRLIRLFGLDRDTAKRIGRFNLKLKALSPADPAVLCNHGNWQGKLEYAPRTQYGEGREAQFEGLTVRIPEQYDAYLTQKYGDWRADLPAEQQKGHHFAEIVDLTRSYTDYLESSPDGRVRIKKT